MKPFPCTELVAGIVKMAPISLHVYFIRNFTDFHLFFCKKQKLHESEDIKSCPYWWFRMCLCSFYQMQTIQLAFSFTIPGYRCFKAVMFLTGFIFGSIIVYLICLQEKLLPAYGNAGRVLTHQRVCRLTTL